MFKSTQIKNYTRTYRLGDGANRAVASWLDGKKLGVEELRHLAVGSGVRVPVFNAASGMPEGRVQYTDLDLAATKPLLLPVAQMAEELERTFRHNVGRGFGHKSNVMTEVLERSRRQVGEFLGYDPNLHAVIFTPNATAGLNKIARMAAMSRSSFLLSLASHHSAQLPGREYAPKAYQFFGLKPDGTYDLEDMENKLKTMTEANFTMLFVESESNVTGYKPPLAEICAIAEKYGAPVVIDHAQGASGVPLNLKSLPGLVFAVLSGHKMYARDGSGAIAGPKVFFDSFVDEPGGGTIYGVTNNEVFYADAPANQEAGTPAYIAQASLGKAAALLMDAGMDEIERTEREMTRNLLKALGTVEGLRIIGEPDIDKVDRGPIVTFQLKMNLTREMATELGINPKHANILPQYISAALSDFWGIGTRPGYFCAHPYGYFLGGHSDGLARMHAHEHKLAQRSGCAAMEMDAMFHFVRLSYSFVTPPASLDKIPVILGGIRKEYSPEKDWYNTDEGRFIMIEDTHVKEDAFDLGKRGPY